LSRTRDPAGRDGTGAGLAAIPGDEGVSARLRQRVLGLLDHQMLRFAMVGVVNAIFGFGLFALLQITLGDRVHYLVLLVVANIVAVVEAYVLQRWLVFRVTGRWWRELARFSSVYAVALVVNVPALSLLVEVVHLPVLPAQAIVVLATALGTFVAHRSFTFRRPRVHHEEARAEGSATARTEGRTGPRRRAVSDAGVGEVSGPGNDAG